MISMIMKMKTILKIILKNRIQTIMINHIIFLSGTGDSEDDYGDESYP